MKTTKRRGERLVMFERKLGLHVSDRCKAVVAGGKGWSEFRLFARKYWKVLCSYKLLVSEITAAILYEVGLSIQDEQGEKPDWNVEIYDQRGALIKKLVSTHVEEVERVLFFLDPVNLATEMDSLWVLRQAIAEHGQKLNINYNGACPWAEKESRLVKGIPNRQMIGEKDAIVFVGRNPGSLVDRLATRYLDKIRMFERLILPTNTRRVLSERLRTEEPQKVLSEKTCIEIDDITTLLVQDYFAAGLRKSENALCHVIACPGRQRENGPMERLIETCSDPHMKVNLMLNLQTAEEWIQQPFTHTLQ